MHKPNFENPTTLSDIRSQLQFELNQIFCLGENSGERAEQGRSPINPDEQIEKAILRLEEKIDQFFLDNR